jgi:NitT/TauT family transport system permease protein
MSLVQTQAPAEERASVRGRRGRDVRAIWVRVTQVVLLLVLFVGWQFGVSDAMLPYFSRPTIVAVKFYDLMTGSMIYRHIMVTLTEIAIGYAIGAGVGLTLGFALGRSKFLSDALQPYIIGLYSIPKIALAPLFIVWLGLGMASKVAVVFLASFFLVFFNTYSGLLAVNEELVRLARLMKASWPQTIVRVIVPAAAPQIFLGLRTAVPYAVIGAVIGEYIGAPNRQSSCSCTDMRL